MRKRLVEEIAGERRDGYEVAVEENDVQTGFDDVLYAARLRKQLQRVLRRCFATLHVLLFSSDNGDRQRQRRRSPRRDCCDDARGTDTQSPPSQAGLVFVRAAAGAGLGRDGTKLSDLAGKKVPLVDATIEFLKEFNPKPRKGKDDDDEFEGLDSFIPSNVYEAMKEKSRFENMGVSMW